MTFIRIKKIKGIEYAYLINNKWLKTRKQPKQKVVGYLGKVIRPENIVVSATGAKEHTGDGDTAANPIVDSDVDSDARSATAITSISANSMKPGINFFDHKKIIEPSDYIGSNSITAIISDLVRFEIKKNGFSSIEKLNIDIPKAAVRIGKKNVVFKLNDGYLCSYTIKRLIDFDVKGEEEEVGLELAKRFIGAGIAIPNEIFIGIFHKVFK